MSMNPDELVSFANMFSNRTGGPSVKKKSAAQRRRAKAKGLKNAAAIALGQPMGKKVKSNTSKRVEKEQGTRTSTGNKGGTGKPTGITSTSGKSTGSKNVVSNSKSVNTKFIASGSPYVTSAATKAITAKNNAGLTSPYVSAGVTKSVKINAAGMKNAAAIALGSQSKASPKTTKPKVTTGNGPSKLSPSRASSR
jgi:hypothetical protein